MAQTSRPCKGCGAPIYRTAPVAPIRHYCGPDCRPRCSLADCEKVAQSKGMCSAHATRAARYGDPLAPKSRGRNVGACLADGCDKPMRKTGLCANHYQMKRYHGQVRDWSYKWADLEQPCVVCGEIVKPGGGRRKHCSGACQAADSRNQGARPQVATCNFCLQDFPLNRARTGRLQRSDTKWCPDCLQTPDVLRFRRYGITKDFWEAESAKGCQICGTTSGTLHVDHDHNCCPGQKACCGKCVRGLLCGSCNRGIGLLRDSHELVAKAADYLRKYAEP